MQDVHHPEERRRGYGAVALLLAYPQPEWLAALPELFSAAAKLSPGVDLEPLRRYLGSQSAVALQEYYVSLFDRSRAVSLHLFEHSHGDARERGPAMVRLAELYRAQGLTLSGGELPDYLPAVVEFAGLAERPLADALLSEAAPVLQQLQLALSERHSPYQVLVHLIVSLIQPAAAEAAQGAQPTPGAPQGEPEDFAALDAQWEEQAVSFAPGAAVDSSKYGEQLEAAPLVAPERLVRGPSERRTASSSSR